MTICNSLRTLGAIFGLLILIAWTEDHPDLNAAENFAKPPEPDASAQRLAEAAIKDVFKAEYVKTGAADRQALAQKLLQYGLEEKEQGAERFVCFREARDLASRAGDFKTALRAIEEMDKSFQIADLAMKSKALEIARQAVKAPEDNKALAEAYLEVADQAVLEDQYDLAITLSRSAAAAAEKAKEKGVAARSRAREKEVQGIKEEHVKLDQDRKTLSDDPGNPAASAAVGRFLCLIKEDWEKGLPLLEKGADVALGVLAKKELANPLESAGQVSLGDQWWNFASLEREGLKLHAQKRAVYWYDKALPRLEGLTRARIEKRIQEYEEKLDKVSPAVKVFLSDLEEQEKSVGYGQFGKNGNLGYTLLARINRILVNGKHHAKGISLHPPDNGSSFVVYHLKGKYRVFQGEVGIGEGAGGPPATPSTFKILADGEALWTSKPVKALKETQKFSIRVSGRQSLRLEVNCPGKNYMTCAVWLDPFLLQ